MNEWIRRIGHLVHRRRFDQELANEMEFHREMAARDGGPRFGNALRLREESRDAWGWTWLERFAEDLLYAFRIFRRSPGFTFTAVLMLALGIGVNVAAFGFFNLMVLRPLPVKAPATLLHFERRAPGNAADNFSYAEAAFFAEHSQTLSAVLAASIGRLSTDGETRPLNASFVTPNYFTELGASARLGRLLTAQRDGLPGSEPAVVLSQVFWQRHFGADPLVCGKTVRLNGKPATVVGVAAEEFSGLGLGTPDLWASITQQPYFSKGTSLTDFSERGIYVQMWGRLQHGLTPKIAEAELASLAARLWKSHPKDIWEKESLPSRPGGYAIRMRAEMYPILILAGALGLLILAAACTTLGSLQLARGMAREREIAIRTAVGAGRIRLIRQLFTESLALAVLGSAAGLVLGYFVLRALMSWTESPAWLNPVPDWRVICFAISAGFGAAILFGLAPAWQVSGQWRRAPRIRQLLIAGQVAASCILLIVAGLLVRAVEHAISTPPGFTYQHVLSIDPGLHAYSPERARAYFDKLRSRLNRIPGVESVSLVSNPPLGNRWTVDKTTISGHRADIHLNNVDPEFFRTMGIPMLRGRNLMRGDTRAIVISESLARLQWPAENPIGKQFIRGVNAAGAPVKDTVVGVVGNARLVSPEDSDAVEVYQLAPGNLLPSLVVMVKVAGAADGMVSPVAAAARSIDPELFPEVQLSKDAFERKVRQAGYAAAATSLLGSLALLLACVGIVGLVAYTVSQRTKEIGIRIALGATPAQVLSIVLFQFSGPVAAGLLAGAAGAAALSQVLRQELYGISGLDPSAYLGATVTFVIAAAVAALLPARRALGINPLVALRYE